MSSLENDLQLNALMRPMLRVMAEGITEEDFYTRPEGGGNSPGWILGHIATISFMGCQLLGGDKPDPQMVAAFGPGSSGDCDPLSRPTKSELLQLEESSAEAFRAGVAAAPEELLAAPQQTPFLRDQLPTIGLLVSHLLATHVALHTGQLSAWRRQRGFPSIMQF